MKRILLASSALVASAGIASAQGVEVTGFAEIGILGGDVYATEQFHTDVEVTFTMTGEADNGLTFGAVVQLDEPLAAVNTLEGGETYFLAFGGLRLDMGDTDGAFDAALTEVAIGGSIADDHTTHAGYSGNGGLDAVYDGQIARVSYSAGDFTLHASTEIDDTGTFDSIWGLGVAYAGSFGGTDIGVGLGYQTGDETNSDVSVAVTNVAVLAAILALPPGASNEDILVAALGAAAHEPHEIWGVSLSATFANGFQGILNYSEADFGDVVTILGGRSVVKQKHMAIGLGYTMNALTIGVNYGQYTDLLGVEGLDSTGYGLAVNYDLGGGLEAQFGYGKSDIDFSIPGFSASTSFDQYSLGLAMTF
ncbi:MAG: porin [Paracoccaceae bacterium]|nr:porin [Paracoccaceae bacterium]